MVRCPFCNQVEHGIVHNGMVKVELHYTDHGVGRMCDGSHVSVVISLSQHNKVK